MTTHAKMWACRLDTEQHLRTCGYWYTVTADGQAHTAFRTRAGLDRWTAERGLSLAGPLDAEPSHCRIEGTYRTHMHMDPDQFEAVPGERTRTLSNGDYVVAILERAADGVVTVHTLNPNVRDRKVFDYRESERMMCSP